MSSNLAELVVALNLEASKFTEGVAKSQKQLADFRRSVSDSISNIAAAFGAGLSIDKVVEFSRAVLDGADSLAKLAAQTGASVEALSDLQNVAKITGIEDLSTAFAHLSKAQGEVGQGNKQIAGAFSAIGIGAEHDLPAFFGPVVT